jgi:CheY-like chemotaxis protein
MGIMGNAGLALMEMSADSPARKTVQRIEKASLRAAELTNQLLAYSGKGKFLVEPVDISLLVNEMTHLLRAAISKQAALCLELEDELPAFEADATQIRQVVMNLIMNSSEALGPGGGNITVRTGTIHASSGYLSSSYLSDGLEEGEYVYIEVEDDGCGMDEEMISRAFDPFFTTKFTGRGLGLAAVLGVVRGHHGTIDVRSEVGRGSSFRVLFRCGDEPVSPGPGESPVAQVDDSMEAGEGFPEGLTVLVVDDEEAVRDTAREILERFGFRVLQASDGAEAVEVYRDRPEEISIVLLDMTMPRMSGEQALGAIRKLDPSARVLLTSGYTEQHARAHLHTDTLSDFIQKPYRPSDLVDRIRRILQQPGEPN